MNSLRCLLGDGLRVRGMASPHPFLGATPLAGEARVVLAGAVFFLVQFVVGDVEWDWLHQVAGWRTWCVRVPSSLWSPLLLRGERSRCASCFGYGRPCDYTAQVPAVLRERGGASDSVLDRVLQIPVVLQKRVRAVQTVQKPEIPTCSSSTVVELPAVVR